VPYKCTAALQFLTQLFNLVMGRPLQSNGYLFFYGTAATYKDAVKGCLALNKTLITLNKQDNLDTVTKLITG